MFKPLAVPGRDVFKITEPTCISFSGGRTSAYMLWRVLQSNGGLPSDAVVCFANTGLEAEETLEFVRDCGLAWKVPIHWLEFRDDPARKFEEVRFDSASRNGEPFSALIDKRGFLPNAVARFCTSELKIRTMHRWLRANWQALGWDVDNVEWSQMIGIRADEQRRVAKIRARGRSTESKSESMLMPLADAGVSVLDIGRFWDAQPFQLNLPNRNGRTTAGNCELCFLKPAAQILSLIREKPGRAAWWINAEATSRASKSSGARFRNDRPSYASMAAYAQAQDDMFPRDEDAVACYCGD